jgi:hypothetical protein
LWIKEEVGCRLQEGVQLCNSGMVKKEHFEKNQDPGKLWTVQEIDHHRNEKGPGTQKRHKGPRPKTEATRQQGNNRPSQQMANILEKEENNQHDLQEDHRAGDREASSRDFQWAVKNQELDLVER